MLVLPRMMLSCLCSTAGCLVLPGTGHWAVLTNRQAFQLPHVSFENCVGLYLSNCVGLCRLFPRTRRVMFAHVATWPHLPVCTNIPALLVDGIPFIP